MTQKSVVWTPHLCRIKGGSWVEHTLRSELWYSFQFGHYLTQQKIYNRGSCYSVTLSVRHRGQDLSILWKGKTETVWCPGKELACTLAASLRPWTRHLIFLGLAFSIYKVSRTRLSLLKKIYICNLFYPPFFSCVQAFSSCGKRGLLSSWSARVSRCGSVSPVAELRLLLQSAGSRE